MRGSNELVLGCQHQDADLTLNLSERLASLLQTLRGTARDNPAGHISKRKHSQLRRPSREPMVRS